MGYKNLEKVLEEKSMSKLQLALSVKIHPAMIYDAFNGKRVFHPGYKKKIAEFLEMDEEFLFTGEN